MPKFNPVNRYLFLVLLFILSCQSDQKEIQSQNIIGVWRAEKVTLSGKAKVGGFPIPFSQSKDNECTKESRLELNEDGSGLTTLKDDTVGSCEALQEIQFTYEYHPETKELVIRYNDFSEIVKVQRLTAQQFTLQRKVDHLRFNGIDFSGTITIDFTRN